MTKTTRLVPMMFFCASAARPQTDRGSIRGTVLDPTGAVIPNVSVTATLQRRAPYNFSALQSGTYRVSVQQPGFKNLVHEKMEVAAAAVIGLDLSLQVGDVGQTVSITSEAPLLQTETSSTGTTVDNRAFVDLPLSSGGGRRSNAYLQLVRDTPGVREASPTVSMAVVGCPYADEVAGSPNAHFNSDAFL